MGAGLASMLRWALGEIVQPFIFTAKSKSYLGRKFLALIETGRFKDYARAEAASDELQALFVRQLEMCQMEILPGPSRLLRWGVPEGRRDPQTGRRVHDDLLVSGALCAALDDQPASPAWSSVIEANFEALGGQ